MEKIIIKSYNTPAGELLLGDWRGKLCLLDWKYRKMRQSIDKRIQSGLQASYEEGHTELFDKVESQINEYFAGQRKEFDISLQLVGTPFQQSVWEALIQIPYGKKETYLGLSRILQNEKAIRAVASANGANAISIIVPCHRIIGSNGSLGGYAGGLDAKRRLLDLESQLHFSM